MYWQHCQYKATHIRLSNTAGFKDQHKTTKFPFRKNANQPWLSASSRLFFLTVFKKLKAEKTQGWKKLKAVFQPKTQRLGDFWGSSQKTQKKKLYIGSYLFGLMLLMSFLWTCLWIFSMHTHFCVLSSAFQSTNMRF